MKRIFSFVLSALLAVAFTTAHAQQNIFIWKGGNISVKSVADMIAINDIAAAKARGREEDGVTIRTGDEVTIF